MQPATIADFITYVGLIEATELTNIDDASATNPDEGKIQFALDNAYSQIQATSSVTCPQGQLYITFQLRPLMLDIARYKLDTLKQREDVRKAYEDALAVLEKAGSDEICTQNVPETLLASIGLASDVIVKSVGGARIWSQETLTPYRKPKLYL